MQLTEPPSYQVLRLHALAGEHPETTVAVGDINTLPGQVDVVPGSETLTIDLRHRTSQC
ncbi:hypothetical protein ACIOKD_37860 [Streptomyces sp. NPDC087844]|uniref:hypothetical protein n=1 Tax=Streptomyces sp. NPDC087844 TaxID=3365805 RepID=UPI0037F796AE